MTQAFFVALLAALLAAGAHAQVPPTSAEIYMYSGLHRAAADNNAREIIRLAKSGANVNARDAYGRTPLHVATYRGHREAIRALATAGANLNLTEHDRYDAVTIAAVQNDAETLRLLLELGANPGAVTSRYDGTALIAAAHLGNVESVRLLIEAGAPLDHINNIGWTAVLEAIVLGDGGKRHVETLRALVNAGADVNIADRSGLRPLQHARNRGYTEMAKILEQAGAKALDRKSQ